MATPARLSIAPDRQPSDDHRSQPHSHLWHLRDGTPVHAPPGGLSTDDQGHVACHFCGQWFLHLGGHLRGHGITAADYRNAVGLARNKPLCGPDVSTAISRRQRQHYQQDASVRESFAVGQQAARSGALSELARKAAAGRSDPPEQRAQRAAALNRGRLATVRRRTQRLDTIVAESPFPSLAELLRHRYAAGESLASLSAATGLGRASLRRECVAAGLVIRAGGGNRAASLHAKAGRIDHEVAMRVGASTDIAGWLNVRRSRGATLVELASTTGRSRSWVAARLAGTTTTSARTTSPVTTLIAADMPY